MSSRKPPKAELVGDLETLRTLLDEDDNPTLDLFAPLESTEPAQTIRVGEPAIDASTDLPSTTDEPNEIAPKEITPNEQSFDEAPLPQGSNNDLFESLLGKDWVVESEALLQQTSATIQQQPLDWNPDDTQALTDALRTRLTQTVNGWLQSVLSANVANLRLQLIEAMSNELETRVTKTLVDNAAERHAKENALQKLAPNS